MSDFDAIVVGAGPAGVSAALTMVRGGMKVALLERGPYPGSKNLMGGVLYTDVLAKLLPDYRERGAPLERYVAKKSMSILSKEGETSASFRTGSWDKPPHNHSHTVLRARFDRWFAEQAEKEGVEVVSGVVVDSTIKNDSGAVIGVQTRMPDDQEAADGQLLAPVVVLADGANSLLAEKEGLRTPLGTGDVALAAKEVIKLDEETINDRFGLEGDQGAACEYVGAATKGLPGAGFLYTNRDTVSIGIVLFLKELTDEETSTADMLNAFKAHPAVRPLIRGGEVVEYGAHLLPETGFDRLPLLTKDGLMMVGDAAGLVSTSPKHEGSNFAMASGMMAGQTALDAHASKDYTVGGLAGYKSRLQESFVWKNMEHYRDWPGFVRANPHIFAQWPEALTAMQEAALETGGEAAPDREGVLLELFQRKIGVLPFAMTAVQLRNALKLFGYGKTDKVLEYLSRNW